MRNPYILILFAVFLFISCKFNPNYQGKGHDALQGVWEEEPVKFRDGLLQYTRHHVRFSCDSFYITLETKAKVNYYPDSCFNNGLWKEYAKGNYVVSNDTLYLVGTFTKSNFKQKLSGCYRIGQYLPVFLIKRTASDLIELQDLHLNIPVTLKLKEKINCVPQPL